MNIQAPPDGFNHDDLAIPLLREMGCGISTDNSVAASEALRRKGSERNWTISKAFLHIAERWHGYKSSPDYKSKFRKKAANWLNESDFDNPASWGGSEPVKESPKTDPVAEMRALRRDRDLHPEKYMSAEQFRKLKETFAEVCQRKTMEQRKADAQRKEHPLLTQKLASNPSTVGSQHTMEIPKNNGLEQ